VFWTPADAQQPAAQPQQAQPPQQSAQQTQQFPAPQPQPAVQPQQFPAPQPQPPFQPPQPQPQPPFQPPPARPRRPAPLPRIEGRSRRGIVLETWFVQIAFLAPGVLSAVDLLAAHLGGAPGVNPFASIIPGHPLANVIFGMLTYLQVGAVVPLALLLLSRTGQNLASIGFTRPQFRRDVWPGMGLAASGYAASYAVGIVIVAVLATAIGRKTALRLFNQVTIGHVPAYYILYGVTIAAVTAITEETLVNAYLLTRLEQLGWNPRWALVFSLTLRTSYHVYYGLGFLFTIPLGYFNTRSFQKHRSVMRPIVAHFLYDAVLFTVSVLVS
jgi:membrane protease YdiL (CAAX protease family)